jgi:DNA-binding NarL/FixJ family response regulator
MPCQEDFLVHKIRVLLANHPMMVPDTIRQLVAEQEDMELVGDCRGPMKILQETGRSNADAVIFAQDEENEPGVCSHLLAVYPDITILGLGPQSKKASIWQLCSQRLDVVNTGNEHIVQMLRGAVRERLGGRRIETSE